LGEDEARGAPANAASGGPDPVALPAAVQLDRPAWRLSSSPLGGAWLPVSAWVIGTATVFAVCALTGRSPFRTAPWIHWDAFQYLDISKSGYSISSCFLPNGLLRWCGNAGWFPAYPWLIRLFADTGLDRAQVGVALAWLFDLAAIVLVWAAFHRRVDARAAAAVLFAAFAPGLIYDYAVFPLSMLAFFTVLYLWLIGRGNAILGGFVGFVLVLVYPIAVAAPFAAAVWMLVASRGVPVGQRILRGLYAVVPALVALILLLVVEDRDTGHWDAYFLAQDNYGHHLQEPFAPSLHALRLLFHGRFFSLGNAPAAQSLLVTVVMLTIVAALAVRPRSAKPIQILLVIWLVVAWVIPQATAGGSHYRGEAAFLPAAILIGFLPRVLAAALVAATLAVAIPMEVLFLRNTLI
jgi:hypothetical protein